MFKILTDSTADLPMDYLKEHGIGCMPISYILDGVTYGGDKELDWKEFYSMMRTEGKMPTTSQINPAEAKEYFAEYIKTDKEILHLAFSSGLSGTCANLRIAAQEIMEEHPDVKIIVLDSLCASMGEGLFVHKAVKLRDQGKSMEETARWLEEHVRNLVHVFTVDDLFHLYRGGRVSRTAAVIGTLVSIKPKLHVDDEGHLIVIGKVRGRKKSLNALVDYMEEKMKEPPKVSDEFQILGAQVKQVLQGLIQAGQWQEAYGVAEQLVTLLPDDLEVLKMKQEILRQM